MNFFIWTNVWNCFVPYSFLFPFNFLIWWFYLRGKPLTSGEREGKVAAFDWLFFGWWGWIIGFEIFVLFTKKKKKEIFVSVCLRGKCNERGEKVQKAQIDWRLRFLIKNEKRKIEGYVCAWSLVGLLSAFWAPMWRGELK